MVEEGARWGSSAHGLLHFTVHSPSPHCFAFYCNDEFSHYHMIIETFLDVSYIISKLDKIHRSLSLKTGADPELDFEGP